jgi:hypothetical protein
MAVCRRCGNQMADTAAACPACGELRYQQPAAAQYPASQPAQPQYPQQQSYPQPGYQQPQPYAAPGAGGQPQYAMPVSADEAKGFVGALFDLSFTNFITTKIIKVLYIIAIILAALYALGTLGYGYAFGGAVGMVVGLCLSPIVFLIGVIFARVYMELVMIIFRGAELLGEIAKNTKR